MDDLERARELFLKGLALHNAGRFAEAEVAYLQAADLAPHRPSILSNVAAVLISQGRFAEAREWCLRTLEMEPGHVNATHSLGVCERMLDGGDASGGVAGARGRVLVEKATLLEALDDHAAALQAWQEAAAACPGEPEAALGLANSLARSGRSDEAIRAYDALLDADSGASLAGEDFASAVVAGLRPREESQRFEALLVRALRAPWYRVPELAAAGLEVLGHRTWVQRAARQVDAAWPRLILLCDDDAQSFADAAADPLLLALLVSGVVPGEGLERLLLNLRFSLLVMACRCDAGTSSREVPLAFGAALATQVHLREFALPQQESELRLSEQMGRRLLRRSRPDQSCDGNRLLAVALYTDLGRSRYAAKVAATRWPDPLQTLVDISVGQRRLEEQLRQKLESRGNIVDGISIATRSQYEENPYPRWSSTPRRVRRLGLEAYANCQLGRIAATPPDTPRKSRILVAGAGTGQRPIELAIRLEDAEVLGIDLSRASLAYAQRQAERHGVANVRFLQADILGLGHTLGPFDLIEASGVLHHMAEPARGLHVLRALLAPGGLMRIGLYSRRARQAVAAARELIAAHGFTPKPAGIRAFRQHVMALPDGHPARGLVASPDFYSMSECRDLAFHVHELSFDPAGIVRLLEAEQLEFLGFEVSPAVRRSFLAQHPGAFDWLDLECWDRFEQANPGTFAGMYQFWARPRPRVRARA